MVLDSPFAHSSPPPHPQLFHPVQTNICKAVYLLSSSPTGKGKVTIVLSINFDTCLQRLINYS